jgi:hypothetical protein
MVQSASSAPANMSMLAPCEAEHCLLERCHHQAPLSSLLLSAVHPVTQYTPSQAPSHCKQGGCVCSARAEWHNLSLALSAAT